MNWERNRMEPQVRGVEPGWNRWRGPEPVPVGGGGSGPVPSRFHPSDLRFRRVPVVIKSPRRSLR
ncbi:hypothetical protein GCM10010376_86110 [Streptomyces violaceusniger]